jgi:nicotinate phosphoribosyltransferase
MAQSLALLTDLYQLTMAYAYFKTGMADREAAFHLTFRKNPFAGGFAVACGLAEAMDYVRNLKFSEEDLTYLRTLTGGDGNRLFDDSFLKYLGKLDFTCDIDAIPEGRVVFAHEPLVRVKGPILQCQLVETALLNIINFQTLVATKAARVCLAAQGGPIVEFGLRRAQGINGGLAASRAAYVGGVAATSNVLAGKEFGIPVRGTHAHSWVMAFADEVSAFEAYAEVLPNNCVFLVDTYDSLEGVRHAIAVGGKLREKGQKLMGIRLDSGDLAYLSIEARRMLDEAGFQEARIFASNDLDESVIGSLIDQGAKISDWGVGTRLVTAFDSPALGGVYKLSAIKGIDGKWIHKVKVSENTAKVTTPGVLQVWRYRQGEEYVGDMILDELNPPGKRATIVDPLDVTHRKTFGEGMLREALLVPVMRGGRLVYEVPALEESRGVLQRELGRFHPGIKRFVNPHAYPTGLELGLNERKLRLILEARKWAPQSQEPQD